jgi:hypothetical protein
MDAERAAHEMSATSPAAGDRERGGKSARQSETERSANPIVRAVPDRRVGDAQYHRRIDATQSAPNRPLVRTGGDLKGQSSRWGPEGFARLPAARRV